MAETRVGIVANTSKPGARDLLPKLVKAFAGAGIPTILEKGSAELIKAEPGPELSGLSEEADLVIVLGGDGTILHVVHGMGENLRPLAAINIGSLGFLTSATSEDLDDFVRVIAEGAYHVSKRSVLQVEATGENGEPVSLYGVNEAALNRCDATGIISLEARIDGEFFSNYSGDGLIIATPTGSTAYSFSAGGAIVEPEAKVFLLTPICPHALANRSMVVPDRSVVEVSALDQEEDDVVLSVDGQYIRRIGPKTAVKVSRAPFDLPLVMMPGQTFFQILQQKLRWHGSNV